MFHKTLYKNINFIEVELMTYLKLYGKRLLWLLISIFICLTITVVFYYFNLINDTTFNILQILILLINIFIQTFILGIKKDKFGFLEGIKFSLIIISLFLILSLITSSPISLKIIIYYLIIMVTSIYGATYGINKKKDK